MFFTALLTNVRGPAFGAFIGGYAYLEHGTTIFSIHEWSMNELQIRGVMNKLNLLGSHVCITKMCVP